MGASWPSPSHPEGGGDHAATVATATTGEMSAAEAIVSGVLAGAQSHATAHDPAAATAAASSSSQTKEEDRYRYVQMAELHRPEWFSRSRDDYPGTDHGWASAYCESVAAARYTHANSGGVGRHEAMVLCPYEAYCPGGAGNVPAGGHYKDDEGYVQWSPVGGGGGGNDVAVDGGWVQVSSDGGGGCEPSWSSSASGEETQTRYVLCCRDLAAAEATAVAGEAQEEEEDQEEEEEEEEEEAVDATAADDEGAAAADDAPAATPSAAAQQQHQQQTGSAPSSSSSSSAAAAGGGGGSAVAEEYGEAEKREPRWYDRSSGWEGRTYDEAADFCAHKHAGGTGSLCPYTVV